MSYLKLTQKNFEVSDLKETSFLFFYVFSQKNEKRFKIKSDYAIKKLF